MFSVNTRKRSFPVSILVAVLFFYLSCKTQHTVETVHISVSGTPEDPVELRAFEFVPHKGISRFVDRPHESYDYPFTPQAGVSIGDTSIRLFFSDSVYIEKNSDTMIFYSTNSENIRYNRFFSELFNLLASLRYQGSQELMGREHEVLQNFALAEDVLSKSDSVISELTRGLCSQYGFSKKRSVEIVKGEVNTSKLAAAYFYLGYMPSMFDSVTMDSYLRYYIPKVNAQQLSVFSCGTIASILDHMAVRVTSNYIWWLKNPDDFETYYSMITKYFPKGSLGYDYIVSALNEQAIKQGIDLHAFALKQIRRGASRSAFRPYFQLHKNVQTVKDTNHSNDKSLYTFQGSSFDFNDLIEKYSNEPLLIDFWASWCLPCLKKLPEIEEYKKTYPSLNIISISLDKSQDAWKSFLFNHKIDTSAQYRRNYNNQDSLFQKFETIPKYGFLSNGRIELYDDISDSSIVKYLKDFE